MKKVILKKEASYGPYILPEVAVNQDDIVALHSINNSVTVNLKTGKSIGLPHQEPAELFNRLAATLDGEKAKVIEVTLTSENYTPEGVLKSRAFLTLDHFRRD